MVTVCMDEGSLGIFPSLGSFLLPYLSFPDVPLSGSGLGRALWYIARRALHKLSLDLAVNIDKHR